ncbi:MAG: general secretion pathway protein GspK [Candidatus Jettenia sp.]|nr:general secretion pathway protein GspK [Candidatus Jettenia sp.]
MERENKWKNSQGNKTQDIKIWGGTRDYIADHGYVLIFSLWTIVILGFVALSFTRNTSVAIKTEITSTERIKNIYAARGACIYATRMLVGTGIEERDTGDKGVKKIKGNRLLYDNKKNKNIAGRRPWKPRSRPYSVQIGERNCDVFISDESGKININKITDDTKDNFVKFLTFCKLDILTAETITDSLLDWLDKDDLHHINGAEKDYYSSLPDPYEPKNGPFESIEEMALVKGVTPHIFEMIREHLTIYGAGKINVNFASREVFSSIPMITSEIAEAIIQFRKKWGSVKRIDSLKDILSQFGIVGKDYQKILNYLTISDSNYMTIHAIASSDKIKNSYKIVIQKSLDNCKVIAAYP